MSQHYGKHAQTHPSNRAFFIRFSVVVFALNVLAGILILIARGLGATEPDPQLVRAAIEARIAPIGQVVTEDSVAEAPGGGAPGSTNPATAPVANALSGEDVAKARCGSCHEPGILGAPKTHDPQAWAQREQAAGGLDGLVQSAIRGKNAMPPRGGFPDLSDAQIRAAIEVMRR